MDVIQIVLLILIIQIFLGTLFFIGFIVGKNTCKHSIPMNGFNNMDFGGGQIPKKEPKFAQSRQATKDFIRRATMSPEEKAVAEKIKQINRVKEEDLNTIMGYTGMIEGEEKEGDG